jgi:hypothetical protein
MGIYWLYSRRSAIPEVRKDNYKDVMALLKDISIGKASLPIAGEDTGADEVSTDRTSEDCTFTMGKKSDGSTGTLDGY